MGEVSLLGAMSAIDIVDLARRNLARASEACKASTLPNVGARWGAYSLQTHKFANSAATALEVIHHAQEMQGSFESRHNGAELVSYATMFVNMLRDQFPQFSEHLSQFVETPSALPNTFVNLGGYLISSPVLSHTYNIMRCLSHVRPGVILDIGGGTGSAGRLWMSNPIQRPACYIDLDLPESLFFSEVYLRTLLPGVDIIYVHNRSDIVAPRSAQQIFLVPVHNLDLLAEMDIDLVVNTGSMQEMTTEFVSLYMDLIERSRAKYFYSSNYFAQKIDLLLESMNFAAPTLSAAWTSIFRKWHPDEFRPVAEMMFVRNSAHLTGATPILESEKIDGGPAFLNAFEAVRGASSADVIFPVIQKTLEGMNYVPKELLWLARRARSLDPASSKIAESLNNLEQCAARGFRQMGMVAENAEVARAEFARYLFPPTSSGRLQSLRGRPKVNIADMQRTFRPDNCGSIERMSKIGDTFIVSGWALDRVTGEVPSCIHGFQNKVLVASTSLTIERHEFGMLNPVIGFEFVLSSEQTPYILAEFADGSVGDLSNQPTQPRIFKRFKAAFRPAGWLRRVLRLVAGR